MSRFLLSILVLLTFPGVLPLTPGAGPVNTPNSGYTLHLPLVINDNGLRLTVTTLDNCQYCTFYDALGYIENVATQPYSVTLEAEITIYPYTPPGSEPQSPHTETVQFKPALEASLPGQANPFNLEELCYKACTIINAIHIKKVEPLTPGSYYPLTILHWSYQNGVLSGVAKNNSNQTLSGARVVVAGLDQCPWKEAVLDSATLPPSQQTGFQVSYPTSCINQRLLIIGQGTTVAP